MQNKKKKILFFTFGGVGGAERMTVNIGKMLPQEEFEVKFVVCWRKDEICQFIPEEYVIIRIPWHNRYCFIRTRMAFVLLKEKPDFVFSSTMLLNIRLLQVCSVLNIKCIVRNDNMLSLTTDSRRRQMKKWYPKAYYVIAQQEEMGGEIIKQLSIDQRKVVVLHNVIDTETIDQKLATAQNPYLVESAVNYVWVGRIDREKGQDILIKALYIVNKSNPNAHVYFVGAFDESDSYYKELLTLISECQLQDYIHFVGYDTNPYRWIKYCDCFVLPSRLEGLPNALIEAQYIGRPCVAAECIPMISRIISEGINGYVVPKEDPEKMAVAMQKVVKMKSVKMTYIPSAKADYVNLFK